VGLQRLPGLDNDCRDSTRISPNELHEAEIDDSVRAITNIKKKALLLQGDGARKELVACK
jgi:hypothetical protein